MALDSTDQAELNRIVAAAKTKNYGLRSLLHAVVDSELFRNK